MFKKRGSAGQCNATQSPRSKYRYINVSFVDKPMAEFATWALRLKSFFEKTPAYPKGWLVLVNLCYASLWGVNVTISETEMSFQQFKPLGRLGGALVRLKAHRI